MYKHINNRNINIRLIGFNNRIFFNLPIILFLKLLRTNNSIGKKAIANIQNITMLNTLLFDLTTLQTGFKGDNNLLT